MASVQRTDAAPSSREAADAFVFRLPGGPEAPANARRLAERLEGQIPERVRADVTLMLTEIVANAVLHGQAGHELVIEFVEDDEHVGFRVRDSGSSPWHHQTKRGSREGGLGLVILDRLAERWGMMRGCAGTCVWFEVRRA